MTLALPKMNAVEPCKCNFCERTRKFMRIIEAIPSNEDRAWMIGFYDGVVDTETELDMQRAWKGEK